MEPVPNIRIVLVYLPIVCVCFFISSCRSEALISSEEILPDPTEISTNQTENTGNRDLEPTKTIKLYHEDQFSSATPNNTAPRMSEDSSKQRFPVTGVEIYALQEKTGIELVHESGANWVRNNGLIWPKIEPNEGDRNWKAVEELETGLVNAAENGLQVILVVFGTPEWAVKSPGNSCGAVRPDKLGAYADFLHDAVLRYSAPPFNVKFWELGNEPDIDPSLVTPDWRFGCWGEAGEAFYGGEYYADMLRAVYPQIKKADGDAQVLVGGLLLDCDPMNPPLVSADTGETKDCTPSLFLEGILKNGGGEYFDGVSFHAYDYYRGLDKYENYNWSSKSDLNGPVLSKKTDFIRDVLAEYGYEEKPIFNTESGLLCGKHGQEPECLTNEFELTKANYAVKANTTAYAISLESYIWYSLLGWRGSGLASETFEPFPVYYALTYNISRLEGSAFIGELEDYPGVKGYQFEQNGRLFWIVWSQDGSNHTIQLTEEPSVIFGVYGSELPLTKNLVVNQSPVYVEWR